MQSEMMDSLEASNGDKRSFKLQREALNRRRFRQCHRMETQ